MTDALESFATPARTLVVAPTRGAGREWARALVRERGAWLGLEITTVRPLALELVGADLWEQGLTLLDDLAEQALVEEVLDRALARPDAQPLEAMAEGVGFRRAVRDAVRALRLAGVTAERLRRAPFEDPGKAALLRRLLDAYVARLREGRLADNADVLLRAAEALERGAPLPAERVLLLPGLGLRGAGGRLLRALLARSETTTLEAPGVEGLAPPRGVLWRGGPATSPLGRLHAAPGAGVDAPALELFHAAGVSEELREVLRRVVASGRRWDEVEVVTTDAGVYGPALHALSGRLGVPVTFAVGLPVERTRPGRVVAAYLRWIEGSFPAEALRRLLEAGDLQPPAGFRRDVTPAALARRLRRLRVGWGRERYLPAVRGALARMREEGPRVGEERDVDDEQRRHGRRLRELEALEALLRPILDATPPVPGRLDPSPRPVAPADLARGLAAMLAFVPTATGSPDETARERLGRVLDRVGATLTRPAPFPAAVAALQEHLAIRVPAPRAEGRAPWGSAGGHLHLSDVEHGGWSGRPLTFVVGLDVGRFPGAGLQDPLLLDRERAALAGADLPTSAERLDEARFRMAALLARLRGPVTLSYAAWDATEARTLSPSPVLLQAFRMLEGDAAVGYDALREHLGTPVSRVPTPGTPALDRDDVWLGALAHDGRLLSGEAVVRAAFAHLDAGLAARARRQGPPSAYRGLVAPRPGLDPRIEPLRPVSASRLEALGTCPLRYFYATVLGVSPPEDPEFDADRWLDPLHRGGLLHEVYDELLDEAARLGLDPEEGAFLEAGLRILGGRAGGRRREVPPPSEAVYAREMGDLEAEVRSFVGMIRRDRPTWEATELRFGVPGAEHPGVTLDLPGGGRLLLRGAIDRVDRLDEGGLRVIDYKTGSPAPYHASTAYRGGRRLQHVLYGLVAERLLGVPVARMEYHFPTRKGQNEASVFERTRLEGGAALVDHLLGLAASGHFLPTEEADDCTFCSFRAVCRVGGDPGGKTASPPATWAAEHWEDDAYAPLRAVRSWEERL